MSKSKHPLCGVYSIRNILNNKVYVGSSIDIKKRWTGHKYSLQANRKASPHLQNAWNIDGKENFIFSILTLCTKEELLTQEWAWIQVLGSNLPDKGYNIKDPLGEYVPKYSNQRKVSTRVLKLYKVINIATAETLTLNIKDIKSKYNINGKHVQTCAQYWYKRNSNTSKTCKGYFFVRVEDYNEAFDYITYKPLVIRKAKVLKKHIKKENPKPFKDRALKRIPVIAHEISTGIESSYLSKTECCQSLNIKRNRLDEVFTRPFKQWSHKGYWFRVKKD